MLDMSKPIHSSHSGLIGIVIVSLSAGISISMAPAHAVGKSSKFTLHTSTCPSPGATDSGAKPPSPQDASVSVIPAIFIAGNFSAAMYIDSVLLRNSICK